MLLPLLTLQNTLHAKSVKMFFHDIFYIHIYIMYVLLYTYTSLTFDSILRTLWPWTPSDKWKLACENLQENLPWGHYHITTNTIINNSSRKYVLMSYYVSIITSFPKTMFFTPKLVSLKTWFFTSKLVSNCLRHGSMNTAKQVNTWVN